MKISILLGCAAAAAVASAQPAAAMSWSPLATISAPIEHVRTVCDQWGRCWEQPDYGYRHDYGYGDPYADRYGGYRRPPSKWERKGFCPPGQAKKGNC